MPPRNKPAVTALAQYRLNLPGRPSQGWIADKINEMTGEDVGQQAVSYWELGKVDLKNVHPRRLDAYAKALGISRTELANAAGYTPFDLFPLPPFPPEDFEGNAYPEPGSPEALEYAKNFVPAFPASLYQRRDETYLPQGLLDAIERYGDDPEHADLRDPVMQRKIAGVRGFDGGPQTAGEWLAFFVANRRWLDKN